MGNSMHLKINALLIFFHYFSKIDPKNFKSIYRLCIESFNKFLYIIFTNKC